MNTATLLLLDDEATAREAREPLLVLHPDRQIFRRADGRPWRWKGVSAFPLCDRFARGENIDPFLFAFRGWNLLRVWDYVTWPSTGWESQPASMWREFLAYVAEWGFYVELTLLTDDSPVRVRPAQQLVRELTPEAPVNLVYEIGNEPRANGKWIDIEALVPLCEKSGRSWASGNNNADEAFFGIDLTAHLPRDSEWPRKAHDLLEYYHGGGPSAPTDPAHHMPCIGDEPKRPDQCVNDWRRRVRKQRQREPTRQEAKAQWGSIALDYRAHFGACAQLGGGATFHFEGGKFGRLPTDEEVLCAIHALAGLDAFPEDTPLGPYRRIDEQGKTSRTYVVGDSMTRIRPTTLAAPEPGWTALDDYGILWRRT